MPDGNTAQIRAVAETVSRVAVEEYVRQNPPKEASTPAPLKWAGGIAAALMTMGAAAMATWLVSTVNEMQVTLARMDERQAGQLEAIDRRVTTLEGYHRGGRQ